MKNKLTDLNDTLFVQLERLTDAGLKADKLELELKRTDAVVELSHTIVTNARLQLDAARLVAEHPQLLQRLPMLGAGSNGNGNGAAIGAGNGTGHARLNSGEIRG